MRELLTGPQSSGSTKVSKESTVSSWMLFRPLSQPPIHRKVVVWRFSWILRSFPELEKLSHDVLVWTEHGATNDATSDERRDERRTTNDERRTARRDERRTTNDERRDATNDATRRDEKLSSFLSYKGARKCRREANWEERGEFRRLPEKASKGWGEWTEDRKWQNWQL